MAARLGRTVAGVALVLWMSGWSGGRAAAQPVLAEWTEGFEPPQGPFSMTASSEVVWGESFTCVASGRLESISVYTQADRILYIPPPVLDFYLYAMADGEVVTPAIASAQCTLPAVAEGDLVQFWATGCFLESGITLEAGKSYAFLLSYDPSNQQFLSFIGRQGYTGGGLLHSDQERSIIERHSSYDYALGFQVLGVPEPGTLALLAAGGMGLVWRRKAAARG